MTYYGAESSAQAGQSHTGYNGSGQSAYNIGDTYDDLAVDQRLENGSEDQTNSSNWQASLDFSSGQPDWKTASGTANSTDTIVNDSSYFGGGNYHFVQDANNRMDGNLLEDGQDSSSRNYSITTAWDPTTQAWKTVNGSGLGSENNSSSFSYNGNGHYLREDGYTNGNPSAGFNDVISGTQQSQGSSTSSNSSQWDMSLDSSGNWSIADGKGKSTGNSLSGSGYRGQGSYNNTQNGSTSGQINENGSEHSRNNYTINSTWDSANQNWDQTVSDDSKGHQDSTSHSSYQGSGSYQVSDGSPDGSFAETVMVHVTDEHAQSDSNSTSDWQLGLGAGGGIAIVSGSGKTTSQSQQGSNYTGTGSYVRANPIDPTNSITGTINENGQSESDSNSTAYSVWQNGSWQFADSNGSDGDDSAPSQQQTHNTASSNLSYNGKGNYYRIDSTFGEPISGTIHEDGQDNTTTDTNSTESLDLTDPTKIAWTTTDGKSTQTEQVEDHSTITGNGSISNYTSGSGTSTDPFVSITSMFQEDGHTNNKVDSTIDSKWMVPTDDSGHPIAAAQWVDQPRAGFKT